MAKAAIERYGTINILCANAGIFPASKLDKMTAKEFDAVMGTNLRGTFLAVQACLPEMKARGKGRIVLTSSVTGPITGYPGWAHYGASKAGQLGFMRTAAIELAPLAHHDERGDAGQHRDRGLVDLGPEYTAKMEGSIPMGRLGTVGDIRKYLDYQRHHRCHRAVLLIIRLVRGGGWGNGSGVGWSRRWCGRW